MALLGVYGGAVEGAGKPTCAQLISGRQIQAFILEAYPALRIRWR